MGDDLGRGPHAILLFYRHPAAISPCSPWAYRVGTEALPVAV